MFNFTKLLHFDSRLSETCPNLLASSQTAKEQLSLRAVCFNFEEVIRPIFTLFVDLTTLFDFSSQYSLIGISLDRFVMWFSKENRSGLIPASVYSEQV